jgi:hypothetical protein
MFEKKFKQKIRFLRKKKHYKSNKFILLIKNQTVFCTKLIDLKHTFIKIAPWS